VKAAVTRRLDYAPPAYWIDTVDLTFDLDPAKTRVLSKLRCAATRRAGAAAAPGRRRAEPGARAGQRRRLVPMEGEQLVLENLPEGDAPFALEIFTTCAPRRTPADGPVRERGTSSPSARPRAFAASPTSWTART
jgi:aminopeptidase N